MKTFDVEDHAWRCIEFLHRLLGGARRLHSVAEIVKILGALASFYALLKLRQIERRYLPNRYGRLHGKKSLSAMFTGSDDQWVEMDRLALLHDDGEVAFSFPPSPIVRDLLRTVRHKTSGINQFLDELLNTEP
ncbi:MAG: hypothetical protein ABIQ08_10790 [Duganella sp.]